MALYVYITPECEKEATKHNRYAEIMRLKEKIETTQTKSYLDHFPPPYLKKRFDKQIRLLADYRTCTIDGEEHVVVSFIRIYVRSSKEYASFCADSVGFGRKNLAPLVDNEKVDKYLREQLKENPVPEKVQPSDHENQMLYRFLGGQSDGGSADEFVCESERWVRMVQEGKVEPLLLHIYEALPELISNENKNKRVVVRNHTIVCRWFPSLQKLFLAGIADNEEGLTQIEQDYAELLNISDSEVKEELLLRSSMRTYTALLLADEEGWLAVQKDAESNLALSPEEVEVLESVHDHKSGFPVFINGRAGSGKSTILYYLFADYLNLYLELKKDGTDLNPPILFSCSDDLTSRANDTVSNLIRCNPRWRNDGSEPPEVPSSCFQEFHSYLLSLVPEQDKLEFKDDTFVDYAKFRRLWEKQFGHEPRMRKEAGPDLSWHIIRTYIKGTSPEDLLESEEYTHLPKKQKSVSQKAYEKVFSKVWGAWYKELCEQKGYWDDQDLARYVFAHNLVESVIPAVFCDEAQDFTRVELEILFKLSVFVNRKLDDHSAISRVPYAFAGDPFQTLNPTGFRWDAIQASFHDKLTETLCGSIPREVEINYQELNLNYRSTKNVVKFCNLIQSMRASLFDLPDLRPQQTWQFEKSSPLPVWFDRGNRPMWETLQKESDITIIVPCALNEEIEFVEKDDALRKLVRLDDKNVPQNVLSPARAKGLEFGRVVLYAFAENATHDLMDLLDEDNYDQDSRLPFEYFINQLYVAASRPKKRLFIIDSQKGRDQLWKITSDDVKQKLWSRINNGSTIWENEVGGFIDGRKESWSEDRGDPEENASRYEQQGITNRDPYLLRSAALSYENIGKNDRALICKAKALRLEEQFKEAGDCFLEVGDSEEALSCYWQEGLSASDSILKLKDPKIINRIEYKLVHTLENPVPITIMNQLKMLCQHEKDVDGFALRIQTEKPFANAIWKLIEISLNRDNVQKELPEITRHAKYLISVGLPPNHSVMANLYYVQGEIDLAIEHWEKDPKPKNSAEYRKAKSIQLAGMFEKNPSMDLSQTDAVAVSNYFIGQKKYSLSIRPLATKGRANDLIDAFAKVPLASDFIPLLISELIESLTQHSEWEIIIAIASASVGNKPNNSIKSISRHLVQYSSTVLAAVVKKKHVQTRMSSFGWIQGCSNAIPTISKRFYFLVIVGRIKFRWNLQAEL